MTKEERVTQTTQNVKETIKKSIYDALSAAIIVAIVIVSLDVFGIRDLSWEMLGDLAVEWIPFFLAAILLDSNLYEKGKFIGKQTESYIAAVTEYSNKASLFTGMKLKYFSLYCKETNDRVRRNKQEQLLKEAGITIEDFENEISKLSNSEIDKAYNKETAKIIKKTKKVKIVGLKVNLILGSYNTCDETDIGPTEEEISKNYKITRAIKSIISTGIMTLLGIKDITTWGWAGLLIVVFKTVYTFAKAYTAYFKGYNDVVIVLTNQFIRKTDIFKEYDYWFETNVKNLGNNLEI